MERVWTWKGWGQRRKRSTRRAEDALYSTTCPDFQVRHKHVLEHLPRLHEGVRLRDLTEWEGVEHEELCLSHGGTSFPIEEGDTVIHCASTASTNLEVTGTSRSRHH